MNEKLLYEMVGERIRTARMRFPMSQTKLAKLLDVSRASIVNIEAGRQRAPLHLLWRIAETLKTEAVAFIPRLNDYEAGTAPVQLDQATVNQIESAANGDPATKRRLLEFIGSARHQLERT